MATSRSEVLAKLEAAAEGVIGLGDRLTLAESIVAEFVGAFPTGSGPDGAAAAPEVEGWELDSMLDRARRFLGLPGLLDDGEDAPTRDPVACPEVGDLWRADTSGLGDYRVAHLAKFGGDTFNVTVEHVASGARLGLDSGADVNADDGGTWPEFVAHREYAGNVGEMEGDDAQA